MHARSHAFWKALDPLVAFAMQSIYGPNGAQTADFGALGEVALPYHAMGKINSVHLFGLDELIIFAFYWHNRSKYKRVLDAGANLGLHSILMDRAGWNVTAYEPDPVHANLFRRNIAKNGCNRVTLVEAALADQDGTVNFRRMLDNTTSSHIYGAKDTAHGPEEIFPVQCHDLRRIISDYDFVKMDIEGLEATLLTMLTPDMLKKTDIMLEIGTAKNAELIFNHFKNTPISMFAQKNGWQKVANIKNMPTSYREGSLFLSAQPAMNWAKADA